MSFRVLTLDCGCVPYLPAAIGGTKRRQERVADVAEMLKQDRFDFVCLQGLWLEEDRRRIVDACRDRFPHFREYHGGVVGTGLLTLSRHPIVDSAFSRFALSGRASLTANGVAMAAIRMQNGLVVNVYNSANFRNRFGTLPPVSGDEALNALEASEFVSRTSRSTNADVVILAINSDDNQANKILSGTCLVRGAAKFDHEGNYGLGRETVADTDRVIFHGGRRRRRGLSWETRMLRTWKQQAQSDNQACSPSSYQDFLAAEILATPQDPTLRIDDDKTSSPSAAVATSTQKGRMNKSAGQKRDEEEEILRRLLSLAEEGSQRARKCQVLLLVLATVLPFLGWSWHLPGFLMGAIWVSMLAIALVVMPERRGCLEQVRAEVREKMERLQTRTENVSPDDARGK